MIKLDRPVFYPNENNYRPVFYPNENHFSNTSSIPFSNNEHGNLDVKHIASIAKSITRSSAYTASSFKIKRNILRPNPTDKKTIANLPKSESEKKDDTISSIVFHVVVLVLIVLYYMFCHQTVSYFISNVMLIDTDMGKAYDAALELDWKSICLYGIIPGSIITGIISGLFSEEEYTNHYALMILYSLGIINGIIGLPIAFLIALIAIALICGFASLIGFPLVFVILFECELKKRLQRIN